MLNKDEFLKMLMSAGPDDKVLYTNLFLNYNMIDKNYKIVENDESINDNINLDEDVIKKLDALENEIYTVKGKRLKEHEKISLELENIKEYMKSPAYKLIPEERKTKVRAEMASMLRILADPNINYSTNRTIKYIKKHITIIQGYLDLRIKFFEEGIDVLNEELVRYRLKNEIKEEKKEMGR